MIGAILFTLGAILFVESELISVDDGVAKEDEKAKLIDDIKNTTNVEERKKDDNGVTKVIDTEPLIIESSTIKGQKRAETISRDDKKLSGLKKEASHLKQINKTAFASTTEEKPSLVPKMEKVSDDDHNQKDKGQNFVHQGKFKLPLPEGMIEFELIGKKRRIIPIEENGSFKLELKEKGNYQFKTVGLENSLIIPQQLYLGEKSKNLQLKVVDAIQAKCRFIDIQSGKPIQKLRVTFDNIEWLTTDDKGRIGLHLEKNKGYYPSIHENSLWLFEDGQRSSQRLLLDSDQVRGIEYEVKAAIKIRAVAVDKIGEPVKNVVLNSNIFRSGNYKRRASSQVDRSAEGVFLKVFQDEGFSIYAKKNGYAEVEQEWEFPEIDHIYKVALMKSIKSQLLIVNQNEEPIQGIGARLKYINGEREFSFSYRRSDKNGKILYEIPDAKVDFDLQIIVPEHVPYKKLKQKFKPEFQEKLFKIVLEKTDAPKIEGVIYESDGQASKKRIEISMMDHRFYHRAYPDGKGKFEFFKKFDGAYRVKVRNQGAVIFEKIYQSDERDIIIQLSSIEKLRVIAGDTGLAFDKLIVNGAMRSDSSIPLGFKQKKYTFVSPGYIYMKKELGGGIDLNGIDVVELQRGSRASVIVKDAADQPMSNAKICLMPVGEYLNVQYIERNGFFQHMFIETDVEGQAEITGLDRIENKVVVLAKGYPLKIVKNILPGEVRIIQLNKGSSLKVEVRVDGKVYKRFKVRMNMKGRSRNSYTVQEETKTGVVTFTGIKPGKYYLNVNLFGKYHYLRKNLELDVNEGDNPVKVIDFNSGKGSLKLTLDYDGEVRDFNISLFHIKDKLSRTAQQNKESPKQYDFDQLKEGRYRLIVNTSVDVWRLHFQRELELKKEEKKAMIIKIEGGHDLSIKLEKEYLNGRLFVRHNGNFRVNWHQDILKQKEFNLKNLPGGLYKIRIKSGTLNLEKEVVLKDRQPKTVFIKENQGDTRLILRMEGLKHELPKVSVRISRERFSHQIMMTENEKIIDHLEEGLYQITLRSEIGNQEVSKSFKTYLKPDQENFVELPKLVGEVELKFNIPENYHLNSIGFYGDRSYRLKELRDKRNPRFIYVKPGMYNLTLRGQLNGNKYIYRQYLRVDTDSNYQEVDLEINSGEIKLHIFVKESQKDGYVRIFHHTKRVNLNAKKVREGEWLIDGLPEGYCTIRYNEPGKNGLAVERILLKESENKEVMLEADRGTAVLSGQILRKDNSSLAHKRFYMSMEGYSSNGYTDTEGKFELRELRKGNYSFYLNDPKYATPVTLLEGEKKQLDIQLEEESDKELLVIINGFDSEINTSPKLFMDGQDLLKWGRRTKEGFVFTKLVVGKATLSLKERDYISYYHNIDIFEHTRGELIWNIDIGDGQIDFKINLLKNKRFYLFEHDVSPPLQVKNPLNQLVGELTRSKVLCYIFDRNVSVKGIFPGMYLLTCYQYDKSRFISTFERSVGIQVHSEINEVDLDILFKN